MVRTLQDEMKEKKLAVNNPTPQKRKKSKENYTHREWEEIMGQFRQTYTRKNGAIRSK